jgi:hypothetical protein
MKAEPKNQLVFVQSTENVLAQALQLAFHQNDLITLESLEAAEEDTRRKTLGQLITRLRRRAEIAPDLEKLLDAFLCRPNPFVHGFVHRPEFNLCTEHGSSGIGMMFYKTGVLRGGSTVLLFKD